MAQLFVGQLPFNKFYPEDLLELFSPYGTVLAHELYRKNGNGFVTYGTTAEADAAIVHLHERVKVEGRQQPLQVMYSKGSKLISNYGLHHRMLCSGKRKQKEQQSQTPQDSMPTDVSLNGSMKGNVVANSAVATEGGAEAVDNKFGMSVLSQQSISSESDSLLVAGTSSQSNNTHHNSTNGHPHSPSQGNSNVEIFIPSAHITKKSTAGTDSIDATLHANDTTNKKKKKKKQPENVQPFLKNNINAQYISVDVNSCQNNNNMSNMNNIAYVHNLPLNNSINQTMPMNPQMHSFNSNLNINNTMMPQLGMFKGLNHNHYIHNKSNNNNNNGNIVAPNAAWNNTSHNFSFNSVPLTHMDNIVDNNNSSNHNYSNIGNNANICYVFVPVPMQNDSQSTSLNVTNNLLNNNRANFVNSQLPMQSKSDGNRNKIHSVNNNMNTNNDFHLFDQSFTLL